LFRSIAIIDIILHGFIHLMGEEIHVIPFFVLNCSDFILILGICMFCHFIVDILILFLFLFYFLFLSNYETILVFELFLQNCTLIGFHTGTMFGKHV